MLSVVLGSGMFRQLIPVKTRSFGRNVPRLMVCGNVNEVFAALYQVVHHPNPFQ